MKKTLTVAALAIGLVCLMNPAAYAGPLTLNDTGVVGAFSGEILQGSGGTNVAAELDAAQHLLDMAINASDPAACNLGGSGDCYRTGSNNYSGDLTGGTQVQNTNSLAAAIAAGAVWVLAKYDGQNAGYVLFNLADWLAAGNTTLPQTSADIWVNGQNNGYDISHYAYFGDATTVPDGGATLMLLGAALGCLGILRRRMNA